MIGRVFIKKNNGTDEIVDITKNRGTQAPAITVAQGGTATLDYNKGDYFEITPPTTGNYYIVQSNVPTDAVSIMFVKIPHGSANTITWPSGIKWSNGTTPVFSSTNDLVALFTSASGLIGSLLVKNFS